MLREELKQTASSDKECHPERQGKTTATLETARCEEGRDGLRLRRGGRGSPSCRLLAATPTFSASVFSLVQKGWNCPAAPPASSWGLARARVAVVGVGTQQSQDGLAFLSLHVFNPRSLSVIGFLLFPRQTSHVMTLNRAQECARTF